MQILEWLCNENYQRTPPLKSFTYFGPDICERLAIKIVELFYALNVHMNTLYT